MNGKTPIELHITIVLVLELSSGTESQFRLLQGTENLLPGLNPRIRTIDLSNSFGVFHTSGENITECHLMKSSYDIRTIPIDYSLGSSNDDCIVHFVMSYSGNFQVHHNRHLS